jgi:hypothetical protein
MVVAKKHAKLLPRTTATYVRRLFRWFLFRQLDEFQQAHLCLELFWKLKFSYSLLFVSTVLLVLYVRSVSMRARINKKSGLFHFHIPAQRIYCYYPWPLYVALFNYIKAVALSLMSFITKQN